MLGVQELIFEFKGVERFGKYRGGYDFELLVELGLRAYGVR